VTSLIGGDNPHFLFFLQGFADRPVSFLDDDGVASPPRAASMQAKF
jgi:hypothetical protein